MNTYRGYTVFTGGHKHKVRIEFEFEVEDTIGDYSSEAWEDILREEADQAVYDFFQIRDLPETERYGMSNG